MGGDASLSVESRQQFLAIILLPVVVELPPFKAINCKLVPFLIVATFYFPTLDGIYICISLFLVRICCFGNIGIPVPGVVLSPAKENDTIPPFVIDLIWL